MKVQPDSLSERWESHDPPKDSVSECWESHDPPEDSLSERCESADPQEPLYEEVGDFGLQVLRSLETSFLSGGLAETQEVPDSPPLTLVPLETGHAERVIVPGCGGGVSVKPLEASAEGDGMSTAAERVCTASQELLLQELSSAFTRKSQEEEEEERPYDV